MTDRTDAAATGGHHADAPHDTGTGGHRADAPHDPAARGRHADAPHVAVIGGRDAGADDLAAAETVGRLLAEAGAVVVCGGLGGVMEAACRGAHAGGGRTIGILPGRDRRAANAHVDVAVATGLGEFRNGIVVATSDGVVAVGGSFGTLSEIALARLAGLPVVGVRTWTLAPAAGTDPGVVHVDDPSAAVEAVLRRPDAR